MHLRLLLLLAAAAPLVSCEHLGGLSASYTHDVRGTPVTLAVRDGQWFVSGRLPLKVVPQK